MKRAGGLSPKYRDITLLINGNILGVIYCEGMPAYGDVHKNNKTVRNVPFIPFFFFLYCEGV
jgi:hypothetical protein